MRISIVVVSLMFISVGCTENYVTPGRGATLSDIGYDPSTDTSVGAALDKQPLAHFPTAIAVARVQAPNYWSSSSRGTGNGRFSIVSGRDIEDPGLVAKWQKMPMVLGIAPVNQFLVSDDLQSDLELRQGAARLHADMLLVYTVDTVFHENDLAAPLTLVTLGLAPDQQIQVTSTVSAVLMDTRDGYIYGVCQATSHRDGLTIGWWTQNALDEARKQNEADAFGKMSGQFESAWAGVVKQYGPSTRPAL